MKDYGNQFDEDGIQFKWNAHSIEAYITCPRLYEYTVVLGYRSPQASVHLDFGGSYADALEIYHSSEGDHEQALRQAVVYARVASRNWQHEDNLKTRWTLIRTLVWYLDHFAKDMKTAVFDGEPAVEARFTLELTDTDFLVGTLDRVVEDSNGRYYILDQKTTGSTLSPHYFRQFTPNMQVDAYTWAGNVIYPEPIKGVVIDAAQIAVGFTEFQRATILRTKGQLQEWYDNTVHWIKQAKRDAERGFFPMNTSSCSKYGGCPFRQICSLSPEFRLNFLDANYEKVQ